jgi:hypothetical protein
VPLHKALHKTLRGELHVNKIRHAGVRHGAELYYAHLDGLQILRRQARGDLLAESSGNIRR